MACVVTARRISFCSVLAFVRSIPRKPTILRRAAIATREPNPDQRLSANPVVRLPLIKYPEADLQAVCDRSEADRPNCQISPIETVASRSAHRTHPYPPFFAFFGFGS